jgi:hypothetical protein
MELRIDVYRISAGGRSWMVKRYEDVNLPNVYVEALVQADTALEAARVALNQGSWA